MSSKERNRPNLYKEYTMTRREKLQAKLAELRIAQQEAEDNREITIPEIEAFAVNDTLNKIEATVDLMKAVQPDKFFRMPDERAYGTTVHNLVAIAWALTNKYNKAEVKLDFEDITAEIAPKYMWAKVAKNAVVEFNCYQVKETSEVCTRGKYKDHYKHQNEMRCKEGKGT